MSETGRKEGQRETTPAPDTRSLSLLVDYERYAHLLEESGATDEEKREFLQALWSIIRDFVLLGFGVHPVQQAQETRGQPGENPPAPSGGASDAVCSGHTVIKEFVTAADEAGARNGKGVEA